MLASHRHVSSRAPFLLCALALMTGADCGRTAPVPDPAAKSAVPALLSSARQLVVVVAPDWDATSGTLRRFARNEAADSWSPVGSSDQVVVGRAGLAWGDESLASARWQPVKHEGDGRAPAGVFPLDTAFGFAPATELAWLHLRYVELKTGSDCVDDESSLRYNTVVDRATVSRVDWTSAEHMRDILQYRLGVIVGYNVSPPQRGRGSCIFLHIWGGPTSVTAGCTALDAGELETLMRWLDRDRRPVLLQLTAAEYARLAPAWRLPAR